MKPKNTKYTRFQKERDDLSLENHRRHVSAREKREAALALFAAASMNSSRRDNRMENPRRKAALKARRAAMDAARVGYSSIFAEDGASCPVTGLLTLEGRWVTPREYSDITGIDG